MAFLFDRLHTHCQGCTVKRKRVEQCALLITPGSLKGNFSFSKPFRKWIMSLIEEHTFYKMRKKNTALAFLLGFQTFPIVTNNSPLVLTLHSCQMIFKSFQTARWIPLYLPSRIDDCVGRAIQLHVIKSIHFDAICRLSICDSAAKWDTSFDDLLCAGAIQPIKSVAAPLRRFNTAPRGVFLAVSSTTIKDNWHQCIICWCHS